MNDFMVRVHVIYENLEKILKLPPVSRIYNNYWNLHIHNTTKVFVPQNICEVTLFEGTYS